MQPNVTVLKKRFFIHDTEWELEFTVRGHPKRAWSLHLTPVKYLLEGKPIFSFYRSSSSKVGSIFDYQPFNSRRESDYGKNWREVYKIIIKKLLHENF